MDIHYIWSFMCPDIAVSLAGDEEGPDLEKEEIIIKLFEV